jgi:glycosyltransferase involved in cell wall biosynthesis
MSNPWAEPDPPIPAGAAPLRVLIVSQYFPPEVGAPQTRLFELARRLVERGHRVRVLAPWPSYPTGVVPARYRGRPVVVERMAGVEVVRTAVFATPNRGFVKRILGHLSFTAAAILASPVAGRADVIVVESPPIFHGLAGIVIGWLKGAPFVFNVADLWLESAVEMGVVRSPLLVWPTALFQRWVYRRAALVTTVTRGIAEILRAQLGRAKVRLMTNGVDASFFRPDAGDASARRAVGGEDGFAVLYAGTHGLTQGLDVVLDAAARLRGRDGLRFVFAGEGADKARLVARAAELGLENVAFLPNQPKERMPALIASADACVVSLRDLPLFKAALPSKIFEAMAAARPIVLSVNGEAAELVEVSGGGVTVPAEDAEALAVAIAELAADPPRARRIGDAGRAWVEAHFARDRLARRFEALLYEAARRGRRR